MSSRIKVIGLQFMHGIKDAICGVLWVYFLDTKIQQREAEKRRRKQEVRQARTDLRYRSSFHNSDEDLKPKEPRMLGRVFLSAALGSFIWISIYGFEIYLLPLLQSLTKLLASEIFSSEQRRHAGLWSSVETFLHYIFAAFWVMPLYLISKAVSSVWFLDVADSVYKLLYGRPRAFRSLSIGVADLLYGAALQFIFLQQTYAVRLIPLEGVGSLLYCVHMCLLNALYAFEYKWCNMGMELKVRLYLVDQYWPYFCGFGLPLFLVTNVAFSHYPMVVGACVFSILFPFYIISGTQASVPKQKAPFRLYIFEPSASFCSYVFSFRSRRGA